MANRQFAIVFAAVCLSMSAGILAATLPAKADDDVAAKAQVCSTCHGQSGTPISATFPIIWGQQQNYLYKELHDYHSGDRANPVMGPLVQGKPLDELRALAVYLSAKPWPQKQTASTAAAAPAPPPEAIAAKMQMCKACHQANFEGGAPAPRLAGLSYEYLASSMRAFANGQRTNNLDMPGFTKALTESERDAMAHYLAGL
jgi:cytochrome c553